MNPPAKFLPNGDTVMVVEFGEEIDLDISRRVTALYAGVSALELAGITDLVPTFRSLAIHYDPEIVSFAGLENTLAKILPDLPIDDFTGRDWSIPACYDLDLSPDLEAVAEACSLSIEEVIQRHSSDTYHVYMVGFLPGYPYLGDLTAEIALPRKATPNLRIPARSIAIAERMTAVYPIECPGGWHVIGRTPLKLFDETASPPALLAQGDRVRFTPISRREYDCFAEKDAGANHVLPHGKSAT